MAISAGSLRLERNLGPPHRNHERNLPASSNIVRADAGETCRNQNRKDRPAACPAIFSKSSAAPSPRPASATCPTPLVPAQVPSRSTAQPCSRYCKIMAWQDQDEKPDAFRAMLNKTLSQLRAADAIAFTQDWIWIP